MDGSSEQAKERAKPWMSRKEAAEVVYKDLKESERATFEVAAAYGRWLIASLLLIHGGAIVGAFQLFDNASANPSLVGALLAAVWWLVAGLLLALGCGFSTWLNWSFHSDDYKAMAPPEMLWDAEKWPSDPENGLRIPVTYWSSIVLGLASAACVLGAACSLMRYATGG